MLPRSFNAPLRAWAALALLIAVTILHRPAWAADDAEGLYQQGRDLYAAGKLLQAENAFERAWALRRSYDIAGQLGSVQLELHKYASAATQLSFAIEHWAPSGNPAGKTSAQARLKEALQHVGRVVIQVSPPEAQLEVDGQPSQAGVHFFEPGPHACAATLDGYAAKNVSVQVSVGSDETLALNLEAAGGSGAYWPIVGTGIGLTVAGLAATIALIVVANNQAEDVGALQAQIRAGSAAGCPSAGATCNDLASGLSDWDSAENAAIGVGIATGSIAAITIVYAIVGRAVGAETSSSAWRVTPWVAGEPQRGGGIVVTGSF